MTKKKTNKPYKKLSAGPITATVWKNEEIPSIVFERRYKDSEGKWASTHRLSVHDLPVVAWLAEQVFRSLQAES